MADVTVAFWSVAKFGEIVACRLEGEEGWDAGTQDSHKRPVLETKTSSYRNVRSKYLISYRKQQQQQQKPSIKSRHSDVTRGFGEARSVCGTSAGCVAHSCSRWPQDGDSGAGLGELCKTHVSVAAMETWGTGEGSWLQAGA